MAGPARSATAAASEPQHTAQYDTGQYDTGHDPRELLAGYRRGDFFLASAEGTMLARGAYARITAADPAELGARLRPILAAAPAPIAVGALPFAMNGASATGPSEGELAEPGPFENGPFEPDAGSAQLELVVPRSVWRAGARPGEGKRSNGHGAAGRGVSGHGLADYAAARLCAAPRAVTPVPEPAGHRAAVAAALEQIRGGELDKVVLARALDIAADSRLDPAELLANLARENSGGFTYAADLGAGQPGVRRTLLGASPELLVRRTGSRVRSHPHAGSAPRSSDPATDRANARSLLGSAKDHAEHAMVIEAVLETLRPLCRSVDVQSAPSLSATSTMWHLGTAITGELADPEVTALDLAAALHPTPAVCGTPTDRARALIGELEPFERAHYAGTVGWVDGSGDGEWAVAIRCAELTERALRLYAGGGIVAASDPEAELAETTAKFHTLLRAMGLESS